MLHLIIVDDEKMPREFLKRQISWEKLGIDTVLLACDGEEALAIAAESPPDIVLTDIRMPYVDGIELANSFKYMYPNCHIVFLSGYSDKEYLMSAIKLQVDDYIEKPIDPDEVERVMRKVIASVQYEHISRAQAMKNENDLREQMMWSFIKGDLLQVKQMAKRAGIVLENLTWRAAAMLVDGPLEQNDLMDALRKDIVSCTAYMCIVDSVVYMLTSATLEPEKLLANCADTLGISAFIGASEMEKEIEGAMKAVSIASDAAKRAKFYGCKLLSGEMTYVSELADDLQHIGMIAFTNPREAICAIAAVCTALRSAPETPLSIARSRLYRIADKLIQEAKRMNLRSEILPVEDDRLWEWISGIPILDDVEKALLGAVEVLSERIETDTSPVRTVMNFIESNLGDDNLSLEIIAEYVHMSYKYLCTIFKEETGKTVGQYLTEKRMEKAKELLGNWNMRVCEVAKAVGYTDIEWFVKRFKSATGLTPTDYRKRYAKCSL